MYVQIAGSIFQQRGMQFMSDKKYPRISSRLRRYKNTNAVCDWCDDTGIYKLTIEVDAFRGNDDVVWACEKHKNGAAE